MNKELELAIMAAGDLPTIPIVATKVMQMIEMDNISVEDIAKVVTTDPAVAARVLKIANSAFYGCQRQIQTISGAIVDTVFWGMPWWLLFWAVYRVRLHLRARAGRCRRWKTRSSPPTSRRRLRP